MAERAAGTGRKLADIGFLAGFEAMVFQWNPYIHPEIPTPSKRRTRRDCPGVHAFTCDWEQDYLSFFLPPNMRPSFKPFIFGADEAAC